MQTEPTTFPQPTFLNDDEVVIDESSLSDICLTPAAQLIMDDEVGYDHNMTVASYIKK
jgi:hypothetical protein